MLTNDLLQQHLSLINKKVNTVKDIPAREFIEVFANHLKKSNKFKIPDVSALLQSLELVFSQYQIWSVAFVVNSQSSPIKFLI